MFVFRLGPMSKVSGTEAMLVVLKVNNVDAQYSRTHMRILCLSLSQTQPQPGHFYFVYFIFYVCFSYAVSLIKTIINSCYWQSDWILFHS